MITLRCTKKAAQRLEKVPIPGVSSGTSSLGDWYVNVIPTIVGDFFIFVNERSLLTVAVPASQRMPLQMFVKRLANLLSLIGVPGYIIEREIEHFRDVQIGKTEHRSVLGSMNDIAFQIQVALEGGTAEKFTDLSDIEYELAEMPLGAIDYNFPRRVAVELLACGPGAV